MTLSSRLSRQSMADYQYVTVDQAASSLGVAPRTVRRRIKSGELKASMVDGRYQVELPGVSRQDGQLPRQSGQTAGQDAYVDALLERIKSLEMELEARRIEVQQLHSLLYRPQLPGPSWWQRLLRRRT